MKQREHELLVQRVQTVIELFPDCRMSESATVFRVLVLYGASYDMGTDEAYQLPSIADIITVRNAVQSKESS